MGRRQIDGAAQRIEPKRLGVVWLRGWTAPNSLLQARWHALLIRSCSQTPRQETI